MDKTMRVQLMDCPGQIGAQLQTVVHADASAGGNFAGQGLGTVSFRVDDRFCFTVIPQLHDVEKAARRVIKADLENVDEALMGARDGFEFAYARELTFERFLIAERVPVDDFYRAIDAHGVDRQPDFAIAAKPDPANQCVMGNRGRSVPLRPPVLGLRVKLVVGHRSCAGFQDRIKDKGPPQPAGWRAAHPDRLYK